jgi:7-cyano-7-deazaguanine synthase
MRAVARVHGPARSSEVGCEMPIAIVLLSGGLDSSTVLAIAKEKGFDVVALTFDYGQKHKREIESAKKITRRMGVKRHVVVPMSFGEPPNSSLTSDSQEIPVRRNRSEIAGGIPSTYVPARNIVFLSMASSMAESMGASSVFIAANAVDFSGYPDCTPEFIESFQNMLDVVREAVRLKVPLELTWSCYRGGSKACGKCDSCVLRLEGFKAAGVKDPVEYEVDK